MDKTERRVGGDDIRVVTPIPHATGSESDCEHAIGHLYEFLDSEMTADDEARMRAHMAHCAPCLAELSAEELVKSLVRRSCSEQAPESLHLRIRAQLSVTTTYVVDEG
ncbi:mycothiol system anti-sigma-R factor [Paraoerskovia marina]|uniref:Mycothiol system anti-sigma-R factor n=1 Tax=Paraoerskovia marina TaxID=545619 RepID=A0A1H1R0V2_9CELL|nr:mycothiol system anti-sigma-R factor [Paraoerskovia marina]SDS29292.1 mycothiol system anti-sigma-R factor [Paraoerskovia marina]